MAVHIPTKAERRQAARDRYVGQTADMQLLGEIITWNARAETEHTLESVRRALEQSGLDKKAAKERTPQDAFSRACNDLETDYVVDEFQRDKAEVIYQFSARETVDGTEGREFRYSKQQFAALDKDSGKVACEDDAFQETLQKALDHAVIVRTTNDVTGIVQRLMDQYAKDNPSGDLIPIRDQGGAYLVLSEHLPFVDRIQSFLVDHLGGKLTRWPIPAGTQHGDASVQDSLDGYLKGLVADHRRAVESFTINTRQDTLAEQAERINATRVKVQAYAQLLGDLKEGLIAEVDNANMALYAQIERLSTEREALPNGSNGYGAKDGSWRAKVDSALREEQRLVAEIATETELSERKVAKRLQELIDAGFPVQFRFRKAWLEASTSDASAETQEQGSES